jgi:uncharacterized NAD(P)/FAD-binding protein YdhS
MSLDPARICIIGAGPRGTGVLQRLCALGQDRELQLHIVDPYPPGPGRIWRQDQPDLLWMNSPVSTMDVFAGPDGVPSLWKWFRDGGAETLADGPLTGEASRLSERRFASRPLAGAYLSWVFAQASASARVHVHRTRAIDVRDHGSSQAVWLEGRVDPLIVDAVVLAQGHVDTAPGPAERRLAAYARDHGLTYRPPGHAGLLPPDEIEPGKPVLLRGFGLTFIDQMVLLTQGRAGKFRRTTTGELAYEPSGAEPVLYVGSRRGVPYHAKPASRLLGGQPPLPRFYAPDTAPDGELDFRTQLWPLVVKEILGGYYHELFLGHPERTALGWAEFSRRFADDDPGVIALGVPDPADRLEIDALAAPMTGLRFATPDDLQAWTRAYIRDDLRRRSCPRHSAEIGALAGLTSAIMTTLGLVAAGRIETHSRVHDVDRWFLPFGSYLSSGPPGRRLEELLALSAAGVVRFLGPDLQVTAENGEFAATSPAVDTQVRATSLIETRLAEPTVDTTTDPLLVQLRRRGECEQQRLTGLLAVSAGDHRLLDATGQPHPRRFAVGPCVAQIRSSYALSCDAPTEFGFFAVNDALARAVLRAARH